ncbi:hypothetical protein ES703_42546 [subsurface metagenome]
MKESKSEGVVDRIEGDLAVVELEWREVVNIPLKYLPEGTREGNVLDIIFRINPEREKERRGEIKKLQKELLKRGEK